MAGRPGPSPGLRAWLSGPMRCRPQGERNRLREPNVAIGRASFLYLSLSVNFSLNLLYRSRSIKSCSQLWTKEARAGEEMRDGQCRVSTLPQLRTLPQHLVDWTQDTA